MSLKEDLTVPDALGMGNDEQNMQAFLEREDAPESRPPVREGDNAREEEQAQTTYSQEEQEAPQVEESPEQLQVEERPADELPAEEEVVDEDPVYLVTVAGADVEVPLSELVQGYSRTADYTRKTQSLSDERKAFDTEMAELRAERERNAKLYEQGSAWLESMIPAEPDWVTLRQNDPAEYAAQMAEHQHRREQLRLVNEETMSIRQKEFEDNQRALAEHLKGERDKLEGALPEWKDSELAQSEMSEMSDVGQKTYGYSPEELDQVNDHRAIMVLRDAMLYRRIQAGKPQAVQRARRAPVLKPGAAPSATRKPAPSRLTRAREALKKTGSPKAAEAFFFEALQQEDAK